MTTPAHQRTADALSALDAVIAMASPAERVGLVVQLSARISALGAGLAGLGEEQDKGLDVEEAARRIGVSPKYIYKHWRDLPTFRAGRRLLVSARGLDRWLASRRRVAS